jgi:hypothetical protein
LNQLLQGYFIGRAIHVAAELGVADALGDDGSSVDELALALGVQTVPLRRMLRALAGVGLFTETSQDRFEVTPIGIYLRGDVSGSLRQLARFHGSEMIRRPFDSLIESLRTGRPTFSEMFGKPPFEFLEEDRDAGALFDSAMIGASSMDNTAILAAYDFSGISTLVDVGGGRGTLLAAILAAYPALRGILFDRPRVVPQSDQSAETPTNRCQVVGGDFFEEVPAGGDAYILKNVLHDWDDADAHRILQTCHRGMYTGARLLIIDPLIPPGNEPSVNKTLDLVMLVLWGGHERTAREFRDLLESAGFTWIRTVPTASRVSIIEATR